jgi:pimeloyl-ACP methyl ester carboxylesterase
VWHHAAVVESEFDLQLDSGRVHARRQGSPDAPLVLGVPGLSANLMSFEFIGSRLAAAGQQVVALDLRGRGKSETTGVGSYGWVKHAADLFAVADQLGAHRFSLIGHSMGAAVTMAAAAQDASRLDRIVLIDLCGVPDASTAGPIGASVARLGVVFPSVEAYVDLARSAGVISPWSDEWEQYLRYDARAVDGGVQSRTSGAAVMEDVMFGQGAFAFGDAAGVYGLWRSLTMPSLVLRAQREMTPGTGYILTARDSERFVATVPGAKAVEIDANHYTIATNANSASAITEFFAARY